jgi:hypothetical protein
MESMFEDIPRVKKRLPFTKPAYIRQLIKRGVSKESIRYRLRKARRAGVYFKPVFNRTIYGIEVIE